ncbi:hypothetical protein PLICRDRAFT_171474 [Plicaturopsis crispa FD-325 SS-3]|nr:hypothetical protein PLICRDRAFT_171474 [Plicaturopsis crispa FD-325 SS-3]
MDTGLGSGSGVKKQEDTDESKGAGDKSKPLVKTLNRVPRACNACRKQKMRCEGADNPPCRRCRHAGLECLFEKPSREATLTGEAGLERIRSLEARVSEIRDSQLSIQSTLSEIVGHLRGGGMQVHSPTHIQPPYHYQSPGMQSMASPTTPSGHGHMSESMQGMQPPQQPGMSGNQYSGGHQPGTPMMNAATPRQHRASISSSSYRSPTLSAHGQMPSGPDQYHPPQLPPSYANYNAPSQGGSQTYNSQGQILPPFSSIQSGSASGTQSGNMSSVRFNPPEGAQAQRQTSRHINTQHISSGKRPASSAVASADSSDLDDEENGELPASGLVAPWEVLRGLADEHDVSEPPSRAPSPGRQSRPAKRRKTRHKINRTLTFPDVVTKNILTEHEVRELFRIYYHGCSTFLPVFDSSVDTFEALHERSPFAVDCICMVAAQVRDGGGKASDVFLKCLEEVQAISCATLFAPVVRHEAVQAMILVSGWSDNGWLSGGHAVRMAFELSMHKSWPRLLKRITNNKASTSNEDRELVVQTRTWFCLYLFEHQLSYGTGRPAILRDDESIWQCRMLLQHPLSIEDDMRLVSTVELMAIRERVNNNLAPFDRPVDERTFENLRSADMEFQNWYRIWDQAFSQKYEDAAFYRQSLQIQHLHAELFHNATALRGINGFHDVQNMPQAQRDLAIRSIQIARQGLDITVNSPSYREGMKYAVHYTHATATFAASFLLRLARLFPNDCDMQDIMTQVGRLAALMSEIPGKRYALTLQLMMKRSKRRRNANSRSPQLAREFHPPMAMAIDPASGMPMNSRAPEPFSPTYDPSFGSQGETPAMQQGPHGHVPYQNPDAVNIDNIWRGFEATSAEQLPVWISDQSLGGNSFSQNGMDAFLLPNDYLPPAPQIW